jgi:hypothetical protein
MPAPSGGRKQQQWISVMPGLKRLERFAETDDKVFRQQMIDHYRRRRDRLSASLALVDTGQTVHREDAVERTAFRTRLQAEIAVCDEAIRLWSQPSWP